MTNAIALHSQHYHPPDRVSFARGHVLVSNERVLVREHTVLLEFPGRLITRHCSKSMGKDVFTEDGEGTYLRFEKNSRPTGAEFLVRAGHASHSF
ncbi:hypothetical protein Pst134EB_001548 [Puccinia striiformis f. sp. tritici]|nr:hypothetical protein Pst134EB_001548 [Puccinia striiformis f. sp. tritici]